MAKTKIGTKLLANSAITTAKLNTSAVTRDKSLSAQFEHSIMQQSVTKDTFSSTAQAAPMRWTLSQRFKQTVFT